MIIGIVGSESAKFTAVTERVARGIIRAHLMPNDEVVSGGCHLGGIDAWSIEEAIKLGLMTREFKPVTRSWRAGYKPRNERIARTSEMTICITVRKLPDDYAGMRFPLCYHCGTSDHVKSGGCWTVKVARALGKPGHIFVVQDTHPFWFELPVRT